MISISSRCTRRFSPGRGRKWHETGVEASTTNLWGRGGGGNLTFWYWFVLQSYLASFSSGEKSNFAFEFCCSCIVILLIGFPVVIWSPLFVLHASKYCVWRDLGPLWLAALTRTLVSIHLHFGVLFFRLRPPWSMTGVWVCAGERKSSTEAVVLPRGGGGESGSALELHRDLVSSPNPTSVRD